MWKHRREATRSTARKAFGLQAQAFQLPLGAHLDKLKQ